MVEQTPSMQSEPRIDPSARDGIKRLLSTYDAEQQAKLIRECLRAVKRPEAVHVFNEHIIGLRLPANSDRERIGAMLRTVLRAGRPDAFECLQSLASLQVEAGLSDDQYAAYSKAVEALNESVESGDGKKIAAAAGPVVEALRAGLDEESIERYIVLQALPETLQPLIEALRTGPKKAPAEKKATAKKTTTKKATAKKAGKKAVAKKAVVTRSTAKKPSAKKASGKKSTVRKATRNK